MIRLRPRAAVPPGATRLSAQVFTSLDDVPAQRWDGIAPPDFFFSREYLRIMADSRVEDARYRYVLLTDGPTTAGLAVLSAFTLRLDLLSGDPWIARLRRWLPGLLDLPMICCGIPASFGQHHLHVFDPRYIADAFRSTHRCMVDWAEARGISLLGWKEWVPDLVLSGVAREEGYSAVPTAPDHVLSDLPGSTEEFVGSLRSSYRRKYRPAVALLDGPGPTWALGDLEARESSLDEYGPETFHSGYVKVLQRATVRLERYPLVFFERLASSGLDVRILTLANRATGESLAALLIGAGETLTFALVAKDRARYGGALYTLLLRSLVVYAIQRGYRVLRLGQTSSYAKCAIGASTRRLEAYIHLRGPIRQGVFRRWGRLLFPETPPPELRVFRPARSSSSSSSSPCDAERSPRMDSC